MHYFDWIQAERSGQLTTAEQQAYQHEKADNDRLQAEADAVELMEALLSVGAAGMSDPTPPPATGGPTGVFRKRVWIAGSLVVAALLLGWWATQRTTTTSTVDEPAPAPVKEWGPRFQETVPPAPLEEPALERTPAPTPPAVQTTPPPPVAQREQAKAPLRVPTSSQEAVATREKSPVAAEKEMILEGMQVDKGGVLAVSSEKTIVLKPGFHAKAGARFVAKVEPKDALRR